MVLTESSGAILSTGGLIRRAHYLVSTLQAKGLSTKNLEKYSKSYTDSISKLPYPHLFPLVATKEEWLEVEGVKEKSANTFTTAVRDAWANASIPQRVVALGVLPRGVGMKQMEALEKHSLLTNLIDGSIESTELQYVEGMGPQRIRDILSVSKKVKDMYAWAIQNTPISNTKDRKVTPKKGKKSKVKMDTSMIQSLQTKEIEYILLTGFRDEGITSKLQDMGKSIISSLRKKHTSSNTAILTKKGTNNTKI